MKIWTGGIVYDQHQIRIILVETRLHPAKEFHLDLDAGRHLLDSERPQRRESRIERQDPIDNDGEPGSQPWENCRATD